MWKFFSSHLLPCLFLLATLLLTACGSDSTATQPVGAISATTANNSTQASTASNSSQAPATTAVAASGPATTIKIGLVSPTTGTNALLGQNAKYGVDLAVKELNSSGELGNVKLEVAVEDDKCSPTDAASAIQKAIEQDQVVAIIGPGCSSAVLAALPILDQNKVPALAYAASSAKITESGNQYIFRPIPDEIMQVKVLGDYIQNDLKAKTIAFVVEQTDAGLGARQALMQRFKELNSNIKFVEDIQISQQVTDFTPILTRLEAAKPDAVFTVLLLQQGVAFVKAVQERQLKAPILATVAWGYPLFEQLAGKAADGTVRIAFFLPESDDPLVKKFSTGFQAAYGRAPEWQSAMAYDSTKLLGETIKKGARTPQQIRDALATIKYTGVTGLISFDQKNNINLAPGKLLYIKSQDGKVTILGKNQ